MYLYFYKWNIYVNFMIIGKHCKIGIGGKRHPWVGFSQLYDSGSLLIQSLVRLHNRGIIFPPFTQICPCTTPAPDAFAAADHRLQLSRVSFTSQSNILFEARNIEWHSQVSVCGTVPKVSSPREHFITYLLQSVEKCNLLFYHFFSLISSFSDF